MLGNYFKRKKQKTQKLKKLYGSYLEDLIKEMDMDRQGRELVYFSAVKNGSEYIISYMY